jgi:D-arabinose 1-dehydrogenase-like Zn-dependent alcohol dehydrogenase
MTVNGNVKVMTETFPLDDAADAYEKTASGKVRFCAVYSLSPILEVFSAESLWARTS